MKITQFPFVRKIFGALAGALAALVLYQAYALAAPPIVSWMEARGFLPGTSTGALVLEQKGDRMDRIAAQVREKLNVLHDAAK